MSGSLEREREIFSRCLDESTDRWDEVLQRECEGDIELAERVRRMLAHHMDSGDDDGGFLKLSEGDPERIGPYRILQRLGEGGMGIVYVAEQREPVRRRVAIKVLRGGYRDREVLARFDAERQALALMTHPNIAHILDAGTTAERQPYIVMEFVPGEPITRYCRQRKVSLSERLELFRKVCDAVQHAHQRGVIHRDIKPSNILVMEEDGHVIPKVIDFGIAKAISERLTDHTLQTKVGSLLGTPDYMSPEQSNLSPLDVDTRTDIYSLGAVLYELLTGVTPLQLATSGKSYAELQQAIAEQQPRPPSQCVEGALRRELRGDLDWIVLKALDKQRSQRYSSASEFSADIASFIVGRTVTAGPPSRLRAVGRFLRRHWVGALSVFLIMLTLIASQVILMEKNEALQRERDRANREAAIAQEVTEFTAGLFEHASPAVTGEREATARELLDAGVDQLRRRRSESAQVRAALLEAAAEAYADLGVYSDSRRLFEEAVSLRKSDAGNDIESYVHAVLKFGVAMHFAGERELSARLAAEADDLLKMLPSDSRHNLRAHARLAHLLHTQGRHDEAQELLDAALNSRSASVADDSDRAFAIAIRGRVARAKGEFEVAEEYLADAIEIEKKRDASSSQLTREAKSELAGMYVDLDQPARAEPLLRDLLDETRSVYGDEHPEVAVHMNNLARALAEIPERRDDAEEMFMESIRIGIATRGPTHGEIMTARSNLAVLYARENEWQKSHDAFAENVRVLTATVGSSNWKTANAKLGLARALVHLDQHARAEVLLREALPPFLARFGDQHWRTAIVHHVLGLALLGQGKTGGIEELQQARTILEATLGPEHFRTIDVVDDLSRAEAQVNQPQP